MASVPHLARRESGKKSGPAGESRDRCFGLCEESGFLLCVPQMTEICLSELQRRAQAAVIISDHRGKHRPLPLPPLPLRILCASSGHYPHHSGSLCSMPLPGSREPRPTSLGEHMVHLRLLQLHSSLCHHRHSPHSNYDYLTPPSPQCE